MIKSGLPTLTLCVLLLLAGCVESKPPLGRNAGYPPDLALVFVVQAPPGEAGPMRQTARYVIEPDRTLRVALGLGAVKAQYPPPTAMLTTDQMRRLHDLTGLIDWCTAPPSRTQPRAGSILYHATLTRHGKTLQIKATAPQSPALTRLLAYLVELSGR